jgi:membrane-bound ClpP family serine protease
VTYTLFQLPGLALVIALIVIVEQWVDLPGWFIWLSLLIWILKDAILFPFVWRAYDWSGKGHVHSMIGLRGEAKDRLDPSGYASVRGELWRAHVLKGHPAVQEGQPIQVCDIRGLTLLVRPVTDSDREEWEKMGAARR